jgi:SAM-dependent methyltransferase
MENAFSREEERDDALFYAEPRLVSHLDANAKHTVERLIDGLVPEERPVVLDLMSSVDSHLPPSLEPKRVVGLGLNEEEMKANPDLTGWRVHDLNAEARLPFEDETFDVATNVVSVEYLTRPVEVFREVGRVLKPGGLFLVVFSTRWFPPKVVRVWEQAKEEERLGLVEEFFRRAGVFGETDYFISMGLPRPREDRFFPLGVPSDPIFAVFGEKKGGRPDRPTRRVCPDPADMEVDPDLVAARKEEVGETLECPYCREELSKWEVPDDPCIDWPNEFLYLCFNDACPFVVRGWRHMWNQGIMGVSYRYLFNPLTGGSATVPIRSLADLRPGIVDEEEAGRYPRPGIDTPHYAGLPRVTDYGPDLGGPRG